VADCDRLAGAGPYRIDQPELGAIPAHERERGAESGTRRPESVTLA
jgi:hypothetical protein